MNAAELVGLLSGRNLSPKKNGKGWTCKCPAHDDKNPSLSISEGADGRVLLNCHAGCAIEDITTALCISPKDLFPDSRTARNGSPKLIATYDYHDAAGNVLYQVCRYEPKTFKQRRPDGNGGWKWGIEGVDRVLYRLPKIKKAVAKDRPVVITEGEKDADALVTIGIEATTNSGGAAGKWLPTYSEVFAGADVVIVADKDAPGRKHAQDAAQSLSGIAKTIRVVELPDIGERKVKDAHDWLSAGGKPADLTAIFDAAPEWGKNSADVPVSKLLFELARPQHDAESELLKHRFLCRGAAMLLSGPTGIGKSSLSMQMMILWALGRPCSGIEPSRALKSLLIQAENDEGDLAEFRDGIIQGLNLSPADIEQAKANVIVCHEDTRTASRFFTEVLGPLSEQHHPDLVWIDPALAYLGGETTSQRDVGMFLRNGLAPLLHRFNCAAVIVHHTNKPATGREKPQWKAGDFAYLGSGSAEWANFPRAILALRSIGSHNVFELMAAKRGGRLHWKDEAGQTTYCRLIAHANEPGVICWRDADANEAPQTGRPKHDLEEIYALLPDEGLQAGDWQSAAKRNCGVSEATFHRARRELLDAGRIIKSKGSSKWQPIKKR